MSTYNNTHNNDGTWANGNNQAWDQLAANDVAQLIDEKVERDGSVPFNGDIDHGNNAITNLKSLNSSSTGDLILNALTGRNIDLQINGVTKASVNSDGSFDAGSLHLFNGRLSHQTADLQLNAPAGQAIDLEINGTTKIQVDANGNLNLGSNKLVGDGTKGL